MDPDQGNASNELRIWIDYANARLLEPDAHTKLLVGKWADEGTDVDGSRKIIATFKKDGTYLVEGRIKTDKKEESFNEKGTWRVANGTLETKPDNAKPENPAPDPAIIRETLIFEINDMTFRTWDSNTPADPRDWNRVKAE
jgi:hypothetical protein